MSSNTEADGYGVTELRQMDEQTARQTLTVAEYGRWEKLNDLHDQAEATREQWADEAETVADLTVHADVDDLGTEVDVYGNDLLVHVDPEDDDLTDAAGTLDDAFDEDELDTPDELADDRKQLVVENLQTMLDAVIVRWNGTDWDDLGESTRRGVLDDAREKWGVDGLMLAWVDIAAAVHEDREEKVSAIDSFQPETRGRRR